MSSATYDRKMELLKKAADAFENGTDPFNHASLVENAVTLDECMELSDLIATILKGWLALDSSERAEHVALGAIYDEDPALVVHLKASFKLAATQKRLAQVTGRRKPE